MGGHCRGVGCWLWGIGGGLWAAVRCAMCLHPKPRHGLMPPSPHGLLKKGCAGIAAGLDGPARIAFASHVRTITATEREFLRQLKNRKPGGKAGDKPPRNPSAALRVPMKMGEMPMRRINSLTGQTKAEFGQG